MDVHVALSAIGLFDALPETELRAVADLAATRRLRRGQLLFSEGESSEHLFILATGRMKIFLTSLRGDELLLAVVGPGEALGELSVLDGLPRSASAQALDDVTLVALPAAALRMLLGRSPALALAWAQELSGTVRRLTGSSADLVFLDLPRRLAKFLLDADTDAARPHTVELGLSQAEVAARLGVARQSLNRALSALQSRRWIDVQGSRVVLLDRSALQRFAAS